MPVENITLNGQARTIITRADGTIRSDTTQTVTLARQFYSNKTKGTMPKAPDGWRNPSNYDHYVVSSSKPQGHWKWRTPAGETVEVIGYDSGSPQTPSWPTFPSSLKQRAEVEALLQLKDQRINLAQCWGERDQLAKLVGTTAERIARAYKLARARKWRQAVSALGKKWRGTPKNWLELQYAWKPLLQDVYGGVEEIQRIPPHEWLVTVKGSAANKWIENLDLTHGGGGPSYYARDEHFQGSFVRLDYHPDDDFMILVRRLGLANPAALAWELVPYSFVVDWMLPVGDWLSSLDAAIGFNFRSGSYSNVRKVTRVLSPSRENTDPGYQHLRADFWQGKYRGTELIRRRYTSSPLPRPPSTKNPASLAHMANGLSLLAAAFGGRR